MLNTTHWQLVAQMPQPLAYHAVLAIHNATEALICGGSVNDTMCATSNECYVFHPRRGYTFTHVNSMITPRMYHSMIAYDGEGD
jgi:hypothetical protein